MSWRRPLIITAVLCVTLGIAVSLVDHAPGNRFIRRYVNLRPGMIPQQVDRVFGKQAEYECYLGGLRIRYYICPTPLGVRQQLDATAYHQGRRYASISQLPIIYSSAQVAFDSEDRLVACTRIGESGTIETISGPYAGNQLQRLGDGFFAGR